MIPTGQNINGLAVMKILNVGMNCYLHRDANYSVLCGADSNAAEYMWGFRDPFEVSQAWLPAGAYAGKNVNVNWKEVRTLIDNSKNTYTSTYKGNISTAAKIQLGKLLWPTAADQTVGGDAAASAAYQNAWEHTWENNKQVTLTMEMNKP